MQYDANDVQYDTEEVYESEVHVEDVHLGDTTSVYFNVGLESESEHSEVLSLPSTSEETVTVTVSLTLIKFSPIPLSINPICYCLDRT